MNLDQIRNATPGIQKVKHFNSAGASLMTQMTVDAITEYLQQESLYGGYFWHEKNQSELDKIYLHAAELINSQPDEIALTENASVAFVKALFGISYQKGDVILTSEIEYGNNFLNFLKLKEQKGIDIRVAPSDEYGDIDLNQFENFIDDKVRLIAITHIPTNSGAVAPVEAIGKIAKAHNILYLIDSCQSIGQVPFDVKKIGCDFASATSRKYLRGPRGLGFLYVRKKLIEQMVPTQFDMIATEWIDEHHYVLTKSAKMFENWEKPMAMIPGLSNALAFANELGIENIWSRIQELATYLRSGLAQLKDVEILDLGKEKCGIISFAKKNRDSMALKTYLTEATINTSVSPRFCTALDMNKRGLPNVNRASLHYYNTVEEIDFLLDKIDQY